MPLDTETPHDTTAGPDVLPRRLVWLLLVIVLAANAGASLSSLPAAVGIVFGVLAVALGALLVRDHRRRRRASGAG